MDKIEIMLDRRNEGPDYTTFVERNEEKEPVLGTISIPTAYYARLDEPEVLIITLEKAY